MTTTSSDLNRVEAELARAEAKAAQIRERAESERRAAEQRRANAHEQADRQILAAFDPEALDAEYREAEARLRDAFLADPVWRAYVDYQLAGQRRAMGESEAAGAAARLGVDRAPRTVTAPWEPSFNYIAELIANEAGRLALDERVQREQAWHDAGQAAADGA